MTEESLGHRVLFAVLVAGPVLALLTALVPHFAAGHRLAVDLLLIGLLPYLLYGTFSDRFNGHVLVATGVVILLMDIVFKLPAWWNMAHGQAPAALYTVPLVSASLVALLAVVISLRVDRRGKPG